MWRILVPLQYLRIAHPEKWKFDLGLPLILAAVFVLPIFSSTFVTDALGTFDIVGKLSSFLGVLTGFFIAALAAVATFGKQEMDDPMPGEPPVRLERSASAALIAAIVCCKVLTFDPSDTIPPSTTAIDPIAAT